MPRQKGTLKFNGTIGDLTFYQMYGIHYVRHKTSLNKKRVQTDAAFANSRRSSALFAQAATLAKEVYRVLPAVQRKHGLIGKLTGKANRMLHEGAAADQIKEALVLLAEEDYNHKRN
jgi:hypothetical protein